MDRPTSDDQRILFDLISEFSAKTVVELISVAYRKYGPRILASKLSIKILIQVAELYFNKCAKDINNRSDEYLNEKFGAMLATTMGQKMHSMDILQIIVMLTLKVINNFDFELALSHDYVKTMNATDTRVKKLLCNFEYLASGIVPCCETHEAIKPDDDIFKFEILDVNTKN